jgi:hypothetical protein
LVIGCGLRLCRLLLTFVLFILLCLPVRAIELTEVAVVIDSAGSDSTLYFYYPFESDRLMYDYRHNKTAFNAMDSLLQTESFRSRIASIEITGSACLIGGAAPVNLKLSQKRAEKLAGWLRYKYPDLVVPIRCEAIGSNKQQFRMLTGVLGLSPADANKQLRYALLRFNLIDEARNSPEASPQPSPKEREKEDTPCGLYYTYIYVVTPFPLSFGEGRGEAVG